MEISNIYNKNIDMTTKEYAEYATKLLGRKVSPESVNNMCRTGKVDAYRSEINGRWLIRNNLNFVSYEEHKKVLEELNAYKTKLEAILKIADISDTEKKKINKQ